MYKIKIIYYKPYEYHLLQEKLNQLGEAGYYTDDLAFISFFKKIDQSVYYKIDFFKPEGPSRTEKNAQKDHFYDPYLEANYQPIYHKKGMYVFVGKEPHDFTVNWQQKQNYLDHKMRYKPINYACLALLILIMLYVFLIAPATIDTFSTYGAIIALVGFILFILTCCFRSLCTFYFYRKFYQFVQQKISSLNHSLISQLHRIYICLLMISCLLIGGGLIEDLFNVQSIPKENHHFLMFEDLDITTPSEFSAQQKVNFTIHYYTAIEYTNDDEFIYTKQYQMTSSSKALQLMNDYLNDPTLCDCTTIINEDNVSYGYDDQHLTTLIMQNENIVTIVSINFEYTDEQIQTIIQYYT